MKQKILWAIAIVLSVYALWNVATACQRGLTIPGIEVIGGCHDFQYDPAYFLIRGIDPYAEHENPTGLQQKMGFDKYFGGLEPNQFPSMLYFLAPFTLFDPPTAITLWLICNFIFAIGILYLMRKLFLPEQIKLVYFVLICALFFASGPWFTVVKNGQHTAMAIFFFLLSLYLSYREHRIAAGFSLALSLYKYALTAPMAIYYIYKRQYKELIIAALVHVALNIVAAISLDIPLIDTIIKPVEAAKGLGPCGFVDVISFLCILSSGTLATVVMCLVIVAFAFAKKIPGNSNEVLALLCLLSLVVIYHRPYDYIVMIIPLVIILQNKSTDKLMIAAKVMNVLSVFYVFIVMRHLPESAGFRYDGEYVPLINTYTIYYYLTFAVTFFALHRQCKSEKQ